MEALSWAWLPYSQTSALAGREFISKSVSHSYESHFQHHFDLLPNEVIMHCKITSGFFDVIIASVLSHQTVTEDETSIPSSVISCLIHSSSITVSATRLRFCTPLQLSIALLISIFIMIFVLRSTKWYLIQNKSRISLDFYYLFYRLPNPCWRTLINILNLTSLCASLWKVYLIRIAAYASNLPSVRVTDVGFL